MVNLRKSEWEYDTSSAIGGSVSLGLGVGGGIGTITLKEPVAKAKTIFRYTEIGAGVGAGAKASINAALEGFESHGTMFMTEAFKGNELTYKDISGIFINAEFALGVIDGYAVNGLWLGISTREYLNHLAFGSSIAFKAALAMHGHTQGLNVSVGFMGYVGYLWRHDVEVEAALLDLKSIEVALSTKFQQTAKVTVGVPPIELSGDVLFDFNKHAIKPVATTALQQAGMKIRQYSGKHIVVQGFADSTGSDGYNLKLSQKRADEVRNWLISKGYVNSSNISAKGYGEGYAIASNATAAGRAKNRRVEIKVFDFKPAF